MKITSKLGLTFLSECTNINDTNGMLFGVVIFSTNTVMNHIHNIFPRKILAEGFGSGVVGVKMLSNEIVWDIHFLLNFKFNNLGANAMKRLVKTLKTYNDSVCAIGDFNTIPGKIMQCIKKVIPESQKVLN
jgi:hypothetical protein